MARPALRVLLGLAAASIAVLLAVAAYDHGGGRGTRPSVPIRAIDTEASRGDEPSSPQGEVPDSTAPHTVPSAYRGTMRIEGTVALENGDRVANAQVTCTPMGFRPLHGHEFEALTTHTDASGFFSFGQHPDAFWYEIVAFTSSHQGSVDLPRGQAIDGRLVVTVRPVYYTLHEFLDGSGAPVARLPNDVSQLIRGRVVASTHAAWLPDIAGMRILERMGVRMPTATHVVATAFTMTPGPPRPASIALALPGYEPVSVGLAARPLSQWPEGEVVRLRPSDEDRGRILYDVEIPEASWPADWGEWDRQLDFRIWFVPRGTNLHSSVNRRTPAFSLAHGVLFDLKDQHSCDLPYDIIDEKGRHIVRPQYPEYGFVRVRWSPVVDSSRHYGVTLRRKDDPASRDIVGVAAFPGLTHFGPVAVGEYEIDLQWFMAGSTSALSLVRHLGRMRVRKGANDVACE